jgi:hypothetical protein
MANASYEQLLFNAIKNGQNTVKSVYDIWLELGNTGTPQDFLDSLKGETATIVKGVTIASSAWVLSEGLYKAIISDEKITANNVVNVEFTAESFNKAISNGVLGYTNTIDGGIEFYSNFQPTVDLVIDYSIV